MNRQEQPTSDPNTAITSDTPQVRPPEPAANTPSGRIVRGKVTDTTGNPIVGVIVLPASTTQPPLAIPEIAVLTDEQGWYQWALEPGAYTLTFTREGYAGATQAIVITPDQPTELNLTLQAQ